MKVAIVADWLTAKGGAERVILAIHDIFPKAPVFTTVYDEKAMGSEFSRLDVRTSFLQKWPGAKKHRTRYIRMLPMAIEDLDVSEFDVVISSSSAVGHGVITHPHQLHICYCHTPMRFCWDGCQEYVRNSNFSSRIKKWIPFLLSDIRVWDFYSADRVDHYISNSKYISKRIRKYFNHTSDVIYPPVENNRFRISHEGEKKEFFLVVSRMVEFKKVNLAIEACNTLKLPLKVVGDGPHIEYYAAMAGPTVEILGYVPDEEVEALMREAKGLIFPQVEDFGITPLEAMASGTPVIAFKEGGALETVIDGETGLFFKEQTKESLVEVLKNFDNYNFKPEVLQKHVEKFSYSRFCNEFQIYVEKRWTEFEKKKREV
jgi:glycosyltransferase involved in cell wall biosynthesis